jgi:hypothetical protein
MIFRRACTITFSNTTCIRAVYLHETMERIFETLVMGRARQMLMWDPKV